MSDVEKLQKLLQNYIEAQKLIQDKEHHLYKDFELKINTIKECIWYLTNK